MKISDKPIIPTMTAYPINTRDSNPGSFINMFSTVPPA